jgi:hypothetical protein
MSGALAEEIGPKRCWNEFSEGRGTGLAGCGRESRRGKERSGVGTRSRGGRKGGGSQRRGDKGKLPWK